MQDRSYQAKQINESFEKMLVHRRFANQLPTGGGKTVEFAMLSKRYVFENDKSVLILVHRKELLEQASKTIREIMSIEPVLITSSSKEFAHSSVYIGMIDSTLSRLDLLYNIGLVIIDECHDAHFNKAHRVFTDCIIIGYSATPISSSKYDPLNGYYECLITGPQIKFLIEEGFLAQNLTRVPKDHIDSSKFEIDNRKGDYNENKMAMEYSKPKNVNNVVKTYRKFCKGKKTIIFNVNIAHSKEVCEVFQDYGYNCIHVDAKSKDRDEIIKWFKETEDAILCNVGIATVGFDEPSILNVIINFSTLSLVKYLQCCGRGGRIIDEYFIDKFQHLYNYILTIKKYFNIIDLGGNYERFGEWSDDRDWQYIFNHPDKPSEGIAPCKTCPKCESIVHASLSVCNIPDQFGNPCGNEFKRKKTMEEQDLEEMILVTKGIDIENLIGKNSKKYDYYVFFEMAIDVIDKMYEIHLEPSKEIHTKYFKIYYGLCIEWWKKSMAGKNGNIMDITDSTWHITRARNNFDRLVLKQKPKTERCENCKHYFNEKSLQVYYGERLCEDCVSDAEKFNETEIRLNRGY